MVSSAQSMAANRTVVHFIKGYMFKDTVYNSSSDLEQILQHEGKRMLPECLLNKSKTEGT